MSEPYMLCSSFSSYLYMYGEFGERKRQGRLRLRVTRGCMRTGTTYEAIRVIVAAASSVLQGALTLGESLTHLPAKLVQKILELRYVEMLELLPET